MISASRILAVSLLAALVASCGKKPGPPRVPVLAVGPEATFFVAADTHLGAEGMAERNARQVAAMNALPGKPWPAAQGGKVEEPAAVLVAGDLTDQGRIEQLQAFTRLYGSRSSRGRLAYPVLLGTGNHDQVAPFFGPVPLKIALRQGSLKQAVRIGGLLVIGLDVYPDALALDWLRRKLADAGPEQPVVIWFHYPLTGPYSDWWSDEEKEAFRRTVEGFSVVAVFHGHYHRSGHYVWKGLQVYNVGSPRHSDHSFAAVRWRANRLDVAAWDWERGRWKWHHSTSRRPVRTLSR